MGGQWTGRHWRTGRPVTVTARDGVISEVVDTPGPTTGWIAPGLVDVQVNGMGGCNLNGDAASPGDLVGTLDALRQEGVTRFCPTIVTAPQDRMVASITAIREACESDPLVDHAVLGIHVEGPYISAEDGPRGAHNADWVRLPDWEEFLAWQEASGGRVAMVTLAPELPGAIDMIHGLVEQGVVAAIGHTAASVGDVAAAVSAGATMSTHLGNGSHPLIRRHPNYIWAQLAEDRLWAGLIPDGFHLPFDTLDVMIRAKGRKAILTSDASYLALMPPGLYRTHHGADVVLEPDGCLHLSRTRDILAGSAATLRSGVQNVVRQGIRPLGDAIDMASLHPAELFCAAESGVGGIEVGGPADLITFRWDDGQDAGDLVITSTVSKGRVVYSG